MSTATAPVDDEQLVAQPGRTIIFLARRDSLRLTKVPRYPLFGASGQKVGEKPGEVVPFRAGRFDCPMEGTVALEDGREVDAGEIREWLENHRLIGDIEEGFWRVDPTAPAPSRAELDQLMNAALELDEDLFVRVIAQEEAGWGREDILSIARGALERIVAVKEQARLEAEQEAAQAAPAEPEPEPEPESKPRGKGAAKG